MQIFHNLRAEEDQRCCNRRGDGKFDGESMEPLINRPTLDLYKKSREVNEKTRYDKLIKSRRALSVNIKGKRDMRDGSALAKRARGRYVYSVSLRGRTTAIAAKGLYSRGLGGALSRKIGSYSVIKKRDFYICKVFLILGLTGVLDKGEVLDLEE